MDVGLVNSCMECKAVCCQHGPGPHKPLSPEDYLENFSTPEAYNTKCMALSEDGKCTLWGTPDFPHVCRTHVCNQKIFTKKELSEIESVDDRECPNCNCEWTKMIDKGSTVKWVCEICDYEIEWKSKVLKRGKNV